MKILDQQRLKDVDKATLTNEPISSIDLMERASYNFFMWLEDQYVEKANCIHVFCGVGNNGGDGLAIARFLHEEDLNVEVYLVHFSEKLADELITNFNRAEEEGLHPINIQSVEDFPIIEADDVVVDAIFGIGLNRPIKGFTKKLIEQINAYNVPTYSVDVPSGLFIDKANSKGSAIIKSTKTATFQFPKLAFLLPDNQEYVPEFDLLDIGLDPAFSEIVPTYNYFTTLEDILSFFKRKKKFTHKGSFGHSLIIGGSFGKMGAVSLATKAALRVGSGLVTAYVPKSGYNILQITVPEAMVEVDAESEIEFINYKAKPTVIGVGIGLGTSEKTVRAFEKFLKENKLPLVIDADALNILSTNKSFLNYLPKDSILTPHPKELERLLGEWSDDYDKLEKAKAFSTKYKCILVIKGAHTVVVYNTMLFFNSTGNPALATAGSGDVLTGIITGLLAQSYSALEAAILGVFVHGKTADLNKQYNNSEIMIASDIIDLLQDVFGFIVEVIESEIDSDLMDIDDDFFDDDFDAPF